MLPTSEITCAGTTPGRCNRQPGRRHLRLFFAWLTDQGHVKENPVKMVKELRRQALAPKGLERTQVRRLLREIELRDDVRANAIFSLFLYAGCRVSDLVQLELPDLLLSEPHRHRDLPIRQGSEATVGSVAAHCPPCNPSVSRHQAAGSGYERVRWRARSADGSWCAGMCDKYSAITGIKLHPAPFEAYDGTPVGRQSKRPRFACPNPGAREPEHDCSIHAADAGATGRFD